MTSPPVLWSSYCPIFSFLCSILSMTVFCPFSVGHCIVCPLASDYLFDIFICWPLHCLSIGFWLPLWHLYLLAIALSVHWLLITSLTSLSVGHCIVCSLASDYIFDIFICWPLYCLSIGFWLHLWHLYLLVIALSVHWLLITSLTSSHFINVHDYIFGWIGQIRKKWKVINAYQLCELLC